ncbi:InlB B-repeat-containing protein, partial [Bifidobacterium indicum]
MPADQRVPDGRPAAWPHDDPSRPGWTFDGWFDGDVAWDFTRPVTGDVTLTARWGRWSSGPERGPWKGGTDV